MSLPPKNPSLPQNDTPSQQKARAAQIMAARQSYEWTKTVPSLPGVPLATAVPENDEPTLEWSLMLVGVLLKIVRNALAVKLSSADKGVLAAANVAAASARCDAIAQASAGISALHHSNAGGNIFARGLAAVENAIEDAMATAHRAELKSHMCELYAMIESHATDQDGIGTPDAPSLEAYRALFDTLKTPAIAYTFQDDDEFARLRVAGPNPVLIRNISTLPDNFGLSEAQYASVMGGDTLEQALSNGRLYLCDYRPLEILKPGMWDGLPKYVCQPMALFAVPPGGVSLKAVAIQCGQDKGDFPVFIPSVVPSEGWGWEMAKFIVQVADGNYHELFAHLGHTHLVIEAFAVATHRTLADVHPLWALLVPHFEGLLFINNQAATSLITKGGPIDHIFGGTISSSQAAAVSARLSFAFYERMLPADLAARGVGMDSTLGDYPYRDDALLVWHAIHDWVDQYINIYYEDDAALSGDTELTAWVQSVMNDGLIKGFTPIISRVQLKQVCTMIIFTASAQHAAVNFPQKDVMAFAPAVTGASWQDAPSAQKDHARSDWLAMMPPLTLALDQLNVLTLLGSIHYRPLGDYRGNDWPYWPWFQDPQINGADCALSRFQNALAEVDAKIAARNAERKYGYPYLQPSLIPTSINI
jgi:arachidonate 15-lipoxygenase